MLKKMSEVKREGEGKEVIEVGSTDIEEEVEVEEKWCTQDRV